MSSRSRGFSLIETLVAMLVALTVVSAVGLMGMRLTHRRSSSASLSAATSIAEKAIESLRPLTVPPTVVLANGTTTNLVDETGTTAVGGPYSRTVTIADGPTMTVGGSSRALKRVTVVVTHVTNPEVSVRLETYFRVTS